MNAMRWAMTAGVAAAAVLAAGLSPPGAGEAEPANASRFTPFAGEWNASIQTWAPGAGTPAQASAMLARRVTHADRALVWEPAGPRDHETLPLHTLVYNERAGRYEAAFSSPAAPGLVLATGQADGEGRTIILTGQFETQDGRSRWKEVHSVVDANATRAEFFLTPPGGSETRVMRIEFTRRRPAPPPGQPGVPNNIPPRPIGPGDPTRPPR
jgi:hypothetical protein